LRLVNNGADLQLGEAAAAMATKKKTTQEIAKEASETQLQIFDRAAKLFRAQQYQEAREVFEQAANGSLREVSHNAKLHMIMCDRRLEKPSLNLKTLDDHYNYAVERLNARDLNVARATLERAIELSRADGDRADYVYYAMGACHALSGDARGAYENLKRAIEIDPRNRVAARQDPDFAGASQQPPLQQLLHPEKTASPF
jgi:tetratricopeptide (TPR) repeat protein